MFAIGRAALVLGISACLFSLTTPVKAATVSFTGNFNQDDDVRYFSFNLNAPSPVTLLTYSYGGGTNGAGQTINPGGFEPIVSLFSGAGLLLSVSGPNGSCPPQTVDGGTGLCVDAYLQAPSLATGTYFVALTEFFNVPLGPTLGEGFLQSGTGNFTGVSCSTPGGSFFDETCAQRTSSFALDISGVDSASALSTSPIPEPTTVLLLVGPLAFFVLRSRRMSGSHPWKISKREGSSNA